MHIPDGFINAPVSVAFGAVAVAGVAVCINKSSGELDERQAPLAGVAAAFIFAVQMLNFPVAAGTSGHLLGGALAAILVGPWAGALCVSVVLFVQALVFADGGLSALGLNIVNVAFIAAFAGYAIYRLLLAVLPKKPGSVVAAAGVAAGLSVPISACGFVLQYALGATSDVALGTVLGAMVGVHLLIGIGEGIITGLTVGAVLAVRPDLVQGARGVAAPLQVRRSAVA